MARPKYAQGDSTAQQRLEDAFWEQLASGPYSKITVASISGAAGVNRNTFYYYYDSVDDMAQKMFEAILVPDFALRVISLPQEGKANEGPNLADLGMSEAEANQRFGRMRLYARSGSPVLMSMVKDTIRAAWLDVMSATFEELSIKEQIILEYLMGGAMGLMSSEIEGLAPQVLFSQVFGSPLGRGGVETINQIIAAHKA